MLEAGLSCASLPSWCYELLRHSSCASLPEGALRLPV